MATTGIGGVVLETHDWDEASRFFQSLGYRVVFESDHRSGQLVNGDGPYLFIAEVPKDQPLSTQIYLSVPDAAAFESDPAVELVTPFEPTHWGTKLATVRDPDGRTWSLEAPGDAPHPH